MEKNILVRVNEGFNLKSTFLFLLIVSGMYFFFYILFNDK